MSSPDCFFQLFTYYDYINPISVDNISHGLTLGPMRNPKNFVLFFSKINKCLNACTFGNEMCVLCLRSLFLLMLKHH
jgi:hypothetical protein